VSTGLVKNIGKVHSHKWVPRVLPFKVAQGHRNRHGSTGYLWLPVTDPRAFSVPFPKQTVTPEEKRNICIPHLTRI